MARAGRIDRRENHRWTRMDTDGPGRTEGISTDYADYTDGPDRGRGREDGGRGREDGGRERCSHHTSAGIDRTAGMIRNQDCRHDAGRTTPPLGPGAFDLTPHFDRITSADTRGLTRAGAGGRGADLVTTDGYRGFGGGRSRSVPGPSSFVFGRRDGAEDL